MLHQKNRLKKITLLTLSFYISASLYCNAPAPVTMADIVGNYPAKIYWLIQQLKEGVQLLKNCALFYGPPGNGKTTLARAIAIEANCEFMSLDGPSIVESYVGQGSKNICELYTKATQLADSTGKKVIIFIDEIDAIASNAKTEFRAEHKAALQQLWLELDKHKRDTRVFTIFATNHIDRLDRTFLDRFGNNTIDIKNPDAKKRKEVLIHYFKKADLTVKPALIDTLVAKTDGLSIRSLEDLVNEVLMTLVTTRSKPAPLEKTIWETLKNVKAKFANNSADEEKSEKYWQKVSLYVGIVSGVFSIAANTLHIGEWISKQA